MTKPRLCAGCQAKPVIRKTLRFCHDCLPGGPQTPPPCRRCGVTGDYYSAGLCTGCHQFAPQLLRSCLDCYAWGVRPGRGRLCTACSGWRRLHPEVGVCSSCAATGHVGRGQFCRLCWRTASTFHSAHRRIGSQYQPLDVLAANRDGQQLFLADLIGPRTRRLPGRTGPFASTTQPSTTAAAPAASGPSRAPLRFLQLKLWDNRPASWSTRHAVPDPPSHHQAQALDDLARVIAADRGWSNTTLKRTRLGLRAVLGWQPVPGAPINASDVHRLIEMGLGAGLVQVVLTEAGLFHDDRAPAVDAWFARLTDALPHPMRQEVSTWFEVLRHGSRTPPRSRPRAEVTVRLLVRHAMPALTCWAAAGHQSLREITTEDVHAVLPATGNARVLVGAGLRSLFRTLKARQVVFTNPLNRIRTGAPERRQPLPADLDAVRSALHSTDPAAAALAALLAFHGLRPGQLRALQLIDIRDRRLHLDGRVILLAAPVRERLAAYLDHRAASWPSSINPHLFIHRRTALVTTPVGKRWLGLRLGMPAQAIREDRILHEAHATAGDVRRLGDLFGISTGSATRYAATLDHPDLVRARSTSATPKGSGQ